MGFASCSGGEIWSSTLGCACNLIHMSSATLELYKALVSAGVDETKAKKIAEDVITRDNAKHLAFKVDIADIKTEISTLETRLYRAIAVQTIAIVGAVVGLLQVL